MSRPSKKAERAAAGAWLQKHRLERDWTQKTLGRALGITQSAVSKIEKGTHKFPLDRLQDLAFIFETDLETLMADLENFSRRGKK